MKSYYTVLGIIVVALILFGCGKATSLEQTGERDTEVTKEESTESNDLEVVHPSTLETEKNSSSEETEGKAFITYDKQEEIKRTLEKPEGRELLFKVELVPYPDRYVIHADSVEEKNGEYVIRGKKLYGGDVVIGYSKKAELDAGVKMVICHEGEEICEISSTLCDHGYYYGVSYHCADRESPTLRPFETSRMETVTPRAGEFKLQDLGSEEFYLCLEENFEISVKADTLIYPVDTYVRTHLGEDPSNVEPMTMGAFYKMMVKEGRNLKCYYQIYVESGEVVKVVQDFVYW